MGDSGPGTLAKEGGQRAMVWHEENREYSVTHYITPSCLIAIHNTRRKIKGEYEKSKGRGLRALSRQRFEDVNSWSKK
jgi:hypothetical protein